MAYIAFASFLLIFYTYIGYGLIMMVIKKSGIGKRKPSPTFTAGQWPSVAVLVPAYNEESFIAEKLQNSLALTYPQGKMQIYAVTDGSSDGTVDVVNQFDDVVLLHSDERKGKIAAVNRCVQLVDADIIITTDANTYLNPEAVQNMVAHFADAKVAAVSGEKKVRSGKKEDAAGSGEGLYWKYESFLKRLDSEINTLVGAAGELIAFRKSVYEPTPENMVIEDFYMTMKLCQKGYRVAYEPAAFAEEEPSDSVTEELKRKVRISAGGFQAMLALLPVLNPFKYGFLTFQYVSHRVLRWTLAPVALVTLLISSLVLTQQALGFQLFALVQVAFYLIAIAGYYLKKKKISFKLVHVPFYFCMMNYAVFAGFIRFLKGQQSVLWEKAVRRA